MCIKYERKCTFCATEQGSSYLECDSYRRAHYATLGDQHQTVDKAADQMEVDKPSGAAQQGRDQASGTQQTLGQTTGTHQTPHQTTDHQQQQQQQPGVEECWRAKGKETVSGDYPPGMCKRSDCLKLQDQVREWQREALEDEAGGEHP